MTGFTCSVRAVSRIARRAGDRIAGHVTGDVLGSIIDEGSLRNKAGAAVPKSAPEFSQIAIIRDPTPTKFGGKTGRNFESFGLFSDQV